MTSLMGARKRAEEFARAVDGQTATARESELTPLVGIVDALRTQPAPQPRPEFTAALRDRLLAEAEQVLVEDAALRLPPRRHGARERRLALLASSFVLVGGSAGMAAAAQHSMPGDALYPIKRGLENAQVDLSHSQAGKGRDLLDQASTRLTEARGLLDSSADLHQLPTTLDDFSAQAEQGSSMLLSSYSTSHDPAVVTQIRQFTSSGLTQLQEAAKTAPSDQQPQLTSAAMTLLHIDQQAANLCPSCDGGKPALQLPSLFATAAAVDKALHAAQQSHVDNSHPALAQPLAPPKSATHHKAKQGTGGTTSTPSTPSGPNTGSGSSTTPGGTSGLTGGGSSGGQSGPVPGLPSLPGLGGGHKDSTSGSGDDPATKTKKALKDTTDGLGNTLGGVVGGLLP